MSKYFNIDTGEVLKTDDEALDAEGYGYSVLSITNPHLNALRAWLDPWRPASEPPKMDGFGDSYDMLCIDKDKVCAVGYWSDENNSWLFYGLDFTPVKWRDMPPLPENKP